MYAIPSGPNTFLPKTNVFKDVLFDKNSFEYDIPSHDILFDDKFSVVKFTHNFKVLNNILQQ